MTMDDPSGPSMNRRSQLWPPSSVDLPRILAWLTKPLMPLVERFGKKVPRRGRRGHDPADILLPDGYRADVAATGLSAPVMTCFDPAGGCYVVESGHKVDDPPRIRRVDLASGRVETLHELTGSDWLETGAVTGAVWVDGALIVTNTDRVIRIE